VKSTDTKPKTHTSIIHPKLGLMNPVLDRELFVQESSYTVT
jgi:hypothetical protein